MTLEEWALRRSGEAAVREFSAFVCTRIPHGLQIRPRGWSSIFTAWKTLREDDATRSIIHKRLGKMIGGWYEPRGYSQTTGKERPDG